LLGHLSDRAGERGFYFVARGTNESGDGFERVDGAPEQFVDEFSEGKDIQRQRQLRGV
jgi:hypothetical protein